MAQQTAINWLKDKLKETYDKEGKLPLAYTLHLVQQAKKMHKQEIIDGYANGHNDGCRYMSNLKQDFEHAEQYYQETFKKFTLMDETPSAPASDSTIMLQKKDVEKELFELEQQLDIPSHMRWHNREPKETLYTKEDVLKAGEIGEINHYDYKHIVSLLDEAKAINQSLKQPKKD